MWTSNASVWRVTLGLVRGGTEAPDCLGTLGFLAVVRHTTFLTLLGSLGDPLKEFPVYLR